MILQFKKIILASLACTLLGMNAAEAAVILTFAQDGPNVTATWSGTYLTPSLAYDVVFPGNGGAFFGTNSANRAEAAGSPVGGDMAFYFGAGVDTPGVASIPSVIGSYTGSTFGFSQDTLALPSTTPSNTIYEPIGTLTFSNTTLAALGAENFNNTLAFTGNGSVGGSREIRFTTAAGVPEPTTGLFGLLAVGGLTLRRRRTD